MNSTFTVRFIQATCLEKGSFPFKNAKLSRQFKNYFSHSYDPALLPSFSRQIGKNCLKRRRSQQPFGTLKKLFCIKGLKPMVFQDRYRLI